MRLAGVVFPLLAGVLAIATGCSQNDDLYMPYTPPVADGPCSDDTGNRFVDCGNGTVTDTATGLIWLKDWAPGPGWQTWYDAMATAAGLRSGMGALRDNSSAGSWRLPTRAEWSGILKSGCHPALPDRAGTGCFTDDPWASGTRLGLYWSSELAAVPTAAWLVKLDDGQIVADDLTAFHEVWPVRGP